jgi:hypothetical protein
MPRVPKLLWKIPAALIAVILGLFGSSQAGWSGADVVLNFREMGLANAFETSVFFSIGFGVCYGALMFIRWSARPVLWLMIPLSLYVAIVPSAWNGYVSGFDHSRGAVIRDGWANAYVLEHMAPRGRYESCSDSRIRLTEDAESVCHKAISGAVGEVVPGSGHRCGLFGLVTCYDVVQQK